MNKDMRNKIPSEMKVALYAAYTVDTDETVHMVYTVLMVYTVDTAFTIQTALHCLNSSIYAYIYYYEWADALLNKMRDG